jgi:CheY-like chemotaxis protein
MQNDVPMIERSVRVVLVDDRLQRRRIMREILLAAGVPATDIDEADEADAVIARAGSEPDVAVLERQKPIDADLAAIALLRHRFPILRIEIVSFGTDDETKRLELEAGADGHLDKPVRTADVRRLLDRGGLRAVPEPEPVFAAATPGSGGWSTAAPDAIA